MAIKYGLMMLYFILFCSFKIKFCIYLSSGINSLNKFLYISRITSFHSQKNINSCSLNDGPNCYFTENKYINHYYQIDNENKRDKINEEWAHFYSKIPNENYKNVLQNLEKYTLNYINLYSKESDKDQNPENQLLFILMTFDDETTKKDMYLKKLTNFFYNEQIIADFGGKLKLTKDEDLLEKELNSDHSYPSNLYGIIESDYISISFRWKLFACNYCYVKAHDEKSKKEKITFYGSLSDEIVYSYTFSDNEQKKEKWTKFTFPKKIVVDKLIISGPYDIDNISFIFGYKINVNENENYYLYNYKKKKILVENEN